METLDKPIIIEQIFKASPIEVWEAITQLDKMKQWYFENIPAFEPKVGFETRFTIKNENRVFPHFWKITEVVDMKKISYDWEFEGYSGASNVCFELIEINEGTKLILTAIVLKAFPSDIPEFKRESGLAGWSYFIKESLKSFLEK